MKFKQSLLLIGVVGKKGSGTLDNGGAWETDRIELHTLGSFDLSDSKAVGKTVTVYKVDDYDANFSKAVKCIDQMIVCDFEMIANKNPGQAPKLVCRGFDLERTQKAG